MEQDLLNANFFVSIHEDGAINSPSPFYLLPQENRATIPTGEELEILFEIPQGFLAENDISDIESGG